MDQIKIGKFIKELRKEKNLTQQQLADRLMVSYKTISKWETGLGLPDVSLMLPLCNELGINVNELLSGFHILGEEYMKKAEENLVDVLEERQKNKKKLVFEYVVCIIIIIVGVSLVMISGLIEMETLLRIILIVLATIIIALGIAVGCVLDQDAGYFECPVCHEHFKPTMKSFVKGVHTFTKRKLKCPKCGSVNFCKKKLSKD